MWVVVGNFLRESFGESRASVGFGESEGEHVLDAIFGNLILNWPKLLRPFKPLFFTLYRYVCVRNVILHHFRYKELKLKKINLCFRTI